MNTYRPVVTYVALALVGAMAVAETSRLYNVVCHGWNAPSRVVEGVVIPDENNGTRIAATEGEASGVGGKLLRVQGEGGLDMQVFAGDCSLDNSQNQVLVLAGSPGNCSSDNDGYFVSVDSNADGVPEAITPPNRVGENDAGEKHDATAACLAERISAFFSK